MSEERHEGHEELFLFLERAEQRLHRIEELLEAILHEIREQE